MRNLPNLDFSQRESIVEWLAELLRQITGKEGIGEHDELFEHGVDSLQVIRMARELRFQANLAGLTWPRPEILTPKIIYIHPTLGRLSKYLFVQETLGRKRRTSSSHSDTRSVADRQAFTGQKSHRRGSVISIDERAETHGIMQSLLDKYTHDIPACHAPRSRPTTKNMTVLLTGSTGSLGSYLLDTLYHDKNVEHIICLNRDLDAAEKHSQNGPKRGLSRVDPSRVEFLMADLSQHHLGLDNFDYRRILGRVTHVIRKNNSYVFTLKVDTDEMDRQPVAGQLQLAPALV
jgi:hypothetical protein